MLLFLLLGEYRYNREQQKAAKAVTESNEVMASEPHSGSCQPTITSRERPEVHGEAIPLELNWGSMRLEMDPGTALHELSTDRR